MTETFDGALAFGVSPIMAQYSFVGTRDQRARAQAHRNPPVTWSEEMKTAPSARLIGNEAGLHPFLRDLSHLLGLWPKGWRGVILLLDLPVPVHRKGHRKGRTRIRPQR